MNGIKGAGVPIGIKWANIWLVWLTQPKIINENHNGNAIVIVNTIWLDLVKIYGNNPIILLIKININNEIIISVIPLELGPIKVLNSSLSLLIIKLSSVLRRFGSIQYVKGINKKHVIVLIQFIDKNVEVAGSKVENKFVIIFI